MQVETDTLDQDEWEDACADARAPVQQSWPYGEAMRALGAAVRRLCVKADDRLIALAQLTGRRVLGFAFTACAHGPVWLAGPDASLRARAYDAIRRARVFGRPSFTLFSPFEEQGAKPGHAPGTERMNRLITGRSTVLVDLDRDEDALRATLDGKWRNRLKAAEASALQVARTDSEPEAYRFILEKEEGQRDRKGYQGLPPALAPAFQAASRDPESVIALQARLDGAPVAAMLFLKHGRAATYHLGWADEPGRKLNAHNLLLWRGCLALKAAGVVQLDLGGVDTEAGAGLARFKLGTGGAPHTPAGTFW